MKVQRVKLQAERGASMPVSCIAASRKCFAFSCRGGGIERRRTFRESDPNQNWKPPHPLYQAAHLCGVESVR